MNAVSYHYFRQHVKTVLKKVTDDAEAVIVTAKEPDDNVVVISQRDYDALQETLRILSNPYLLRKIQRGDAQFKAKRDALRELEAD
ncbi:MAG: type II toxin-antitoxin system Phd/YefM family antitoxin [Lactobacillus sp.]|jgi:antitoxin YefM|nr:type II toxin-antitoxin system Phd/YefM family antitoxin [Lactobacillus sp.]MCI2033628.1 type II toxin-antitoxin system Phd/YefM family antitoxin [Lactobacillus sp.]